MKLAPKILVTLLLALFAPSVFAATYYVAKNGSDSNNGSSGSPFATINKAASVAAPGDTVNIAAGTYSGNVALSKKASAGSPIVFAGSGQPVINGQLNVSGSYITVSGVTVSPPGSTNEAVHVSGSYNTLLKVTVTNYPASAQQQTAAFTTAGSFIKIDQYQILNINDIDGFHIWGHDITISNGFVKGLNQVDYAHNHTDWVQVWGLSSSDQSYNVLLIGNEVRDSSCQLGNTENNANPNLHDWTFANNIFNNISNAFFSGIPKTYWYNNIFDHVGDNQSCALFFYGAAPKYDSSGFKVINNVFRSNRKDIGFNNESSSAGTVTNNYFGTASNGAISSSAFMGSNYVNGGDPKFVSAPANYHIQSGSVLIGKGSSSATPPNVDKDGSSRTNPWDIGPYAFAGGPAPSPTPTPAPTPAPASKFKAGDVVNNPAKLVNVRDTPAGTVVGSHDATTMIGTVKEGPTVANLNGAPVNWYSINITTPVGATDGWIGDDNLEIYTGPMPSPTPEPTPEPTPAPTPTPGAATYKQWQADLNKWIDANQPYPDKN
jgi:Protein of unknown function (DUF1565)